MQIVEQKNVQASFETARRRQDVRVDRPWRGRGNETLFDGQIDAAAIDSTVLELEIAANPAHESRLRVIEVLGPSPAPPWVIHSSVPPDTIQQVQEAFLTMNQHPLGQQMLAGARMLRFSAIEDADYDAIRKMEKLAASAKFSLV